MMERELFLVIMRALDSMPRARQRPAKCTFSWREVLAVAFWAALHDRPISWAVQRRHWPFHDRTRALPSSATMSRRLRDPVVDALLQHVIDALHVHGDGVRTLIIDGRPLTIAKHSGDPDARFGRAVGGNGKGYKLHEIVDLCGNCRGFRVAPLNISEQRVARELVADIPAGEADALLADAAFDSNVLYELAGQRNMQLLADRRYKDAKSIGHHRHSVHRLKALKVMASDQNATSRRRIIESCFGTQGNVVGGLGPLPNHVRRLHRVRRWVACKLAIDAAHRWRRAQRSAA